MENIGLHADRLKPDRDNPREVAFAEQWEWECTTGKILNKLVGTAPYYDDVTDRDRLVAATLMQWLGSNVGMSFIFEAMRKEPKIREWLR
jgi:hypothetical protein